MEVFDQGKLIVFEGGVTMVLRMKDSSAKSAGAEATQ
jgi:hypothetical protein